MSNVLNPAIGSIFGGNDSAVARPFTSESIAWRDAVITNGGTVSLTQLIATDNLIYSLQVAGIWGLFDDLWVPVAENATQALTSLKQRRLATAVNSPTFTVDRGYAFDGVTNYIDTGFIPSTHATDMTGSNLRAALYERTNVNSNTNGFGTSTSSIRTFTIRARNGATAALSADSSIVSPALASSNSQGLTVVSRNDTSGTPTISFWKNGVFQSDTVSAAGNNLIPTVSTFIGGCNVGGVLTSPRANTVGYLSISAAFTGAQELAEYNAVQTYMTTKGANV